MKKKTVALLLAMAVTISGSSMGVLAAETGLMAAEQKSVEEISVELPRANVMDVDFSSGDGTDLSELQNEFQVIGNPAVIHNSELHKNVADFDGKSAYLYPFDSAKYEKITEAVTIECMFKFDSIPSSGEHDVFSNQQSGGIGLGMDRGKLTFFAHVGGSYRQPTASIQAGRWIHAVGVVDKSAVKLYVNGKLASQIAASGGVKFTSSENARNFVIGGDSNSSGSAESFSDALVSFARLYDKALSQEEIAALNEKAFEGADLEELKPQQVNLGIVSADTAAAGGEMNLNLHANRESAGAVDKITCELIYDPQEVSYAGTQHKMSGVEIDDSTTGCLKVVYEGSLSVSDFRQFGSTRLGKLNFKISGSAKDTETVFQVKNFHAFSQGEDVTDQMEIPSAKKKVSICAKDSLDLNGDGVIGAGDVALAKTLEQKSVIAGEATIYPYKHAVVLTMDGGGIVWDPESVYYAASNGTLPIKSTDPQIMSKRSNEYAMRLFNEEFATSYTAQAVAPSISGQNYSAMLHGIPWKDVEPAYQLTNDSSAVEYYADFGLETPQYPSVFKAVDASYPKRQQAAFAEWSNILNGIIEPDAGVIGKVSDSKQSFYDVAKYIKGESFKNTALVYMQSDWMDHVGHSTGYYNDTYWSELKQYDNFFKAVIDALKETGAYDETLIIANADHGGSGTSHGSADPSNMDIFIGLGGQTIDSGKRLEGGDNSDIAALALYGLRMDKPQSMTGEVFDTGAFLEQDELIKKNRDIEKVTFSRTGKSGTLTLSNVKKEIRVVDAVIHLNGAQVSKIQTNGGTVLRQEVKDDQLKLTISYEKQPDTLAKITFDSAAADQTAVNEIMLGTDDGKEIYADLVNEMGTLITDKGDLHKIIQDVKALEADKYLASSWGTLLDALKEAQAVESDDFAEQEEIDAAAKRLGEAIEELEKVVDRSALYQKIGFATGIEKENYTEKSWNAFQMALAAAKATAAKQKAGQEEVSQAYAALDKAILALTQKADEKEEVKAGDTFVHKSLRYKVTGKGKAAVTGTEKKSLKYVTIPARVSYKGVNLKVTSVGSKAFEGCKKMKKAVLGKNVAAIGKMAFYGDRQLKSIVIQSKVLKKVGGRAIKGIYKRAVIKVPGIKETSYRKLLKKGGLGTAMKIKK